MSDFEKALHEMFDHIWDCEINHPIFQDTVGELMQAVLQVYDSIKQKQGVWLFKEITDDYHVTGQCSVCKERRRVDNFCPNCGAKMKGVNDG